MIPPDLLEILCCPETHQRVLVARAPLLAVVAEAARGGGLKTENGEPVTDPPNSGLVREDGKFLYPVRNGIPIMLVEERIPVPEAAAATPDEPAPTAGRAEPDDDVGPSAAGAGSAESGTESGAESGAGSGAGSRAGRGVAPGDTRSDDEVQDDGHPDHHEVEPRAGS